MSTFEPGQTEQPATWEEAARQAFMLIEKQSEVIQEQRRVVVRLDRAAQSYLKELHNTLTTVVELLGDGDTELCLEAAQIALEGLEARIDAGNVSAAEAQIGWNTGQTGGQE